MKYRLSFSARRIGALGVWSSYTREVEANDRETARLKLYDEFEHIDVYRFEEINETPTAEGK